MFASCVACSSDEFGTPEFRWGQQQQYSWERCYRAKGGRKKGLHKLVQEKHNKNGKKNLFKHIVAKEKFQGSGNCEILLAG